MISNQHTGVHLLRSTQGSVPFCTCKIYKKKRGS